MPMPNFLIIGAAKSGTTALHMYLRSHPEVFMPERKELRYFSNIDSSTLNVPPIYKHEGVTCLEDYMEFFTQIRNETAIGEASPMYLYTPGTAERIKMIIPNVKLIAILRNPIERAYSAYLHAVRDWREPASNFESALALEEERIAAGWGMLWHYKQAGLYCGQLTRYMNVFSQEQLKIVLYDDLVNDSLLLIQNLYTFLEVENDFIPDISKRPNISGIPKNKFIYALTRKVLLEQNPIKQISHKLIPERWRSFISKKLQMGNLKKTPMPSETRSYLKQFYQKEILNLQDLIQRDLSSWLF